MVGGIESEWGMLEHKVLSGSYPVDGLFQKAEPCDLRKRPPAIGAQCLATSPSSAGHVIRRGPGWRFPRSSIQLGLTVRDT